MTNFYIYTGETKGEAEDKAILNLQRINNNFIAANPEGGIFCNYPEELTAEPQIEGNIYYYGIEEPPQFARVGVEIDLCLEYNPSWKLPIEL